MRIALDALGGDFGAKPNVLGAIKASAQFGYEIILVGDSAVIEQELQAAGSYDKSKISIIHAPDIVDMSAHPARECRDKKDASIVVCARLVKEGKADAMISAGNSGAAMVAALFGIGRIKGIDRPAIASPMPTKNGAALLLDAGANTDCKAINLLQFAVMGSIYSNIAYGVEKPVVGLLSIGEEEGKGNFLIKETTKHIKNLGLNYFGNIEGRDVLLDKADVMVCEGFTGNIILKLAESIYEITDRKGIHHEYFDRFNFENYGGTPVLGVNKPVIIGHGISQSRAFSNMITLAEKMIDSRLLEIMQKSVKG